MTKGVWAGLAMSIALGAGTIGYVVNHDSGSTPPAAGLANIWVNNSNSPNGTCTRSATAVVYNAATACNPNDDASLGVLNAAYTIANAGDKIIIRGGTYTDGQEISMRSSLGTTDVLMQIADGETATFDNRIAIRTHDLVLEGGGNLGTDEPNRILIYGEGDGSTPAPEPALDYGRNNSTHSAPDVANIIVEDVHTRNTFMENNSHDNTLRMSETGPSDFGGNGNICSDINVTSTVFAPTFEYNIIHGGMFTGCPGTPHIDAVDYDATNAVFRGNYFYWCGTQCLFTGDAGTSATIENNMIEETNACGDGCAGPVELALSGTNTVRFNTVEGTVGWGSASSPGVSQVYGNVFMSLTAECDITSGDSQANYTNNIWGQGSLTCEGNRICTIRLAATGLPWDNVDRNANFHIDTSDTCAKDHGTGNPTTPGTDIDAQARPQNTTDAGGDEIP